MVTKSITTLIIILSLCSTALGRKIDAVVKIDSPSSQGSGVIVTPDGVVLTAFHVVPSEPITVTVKGKKYQARIKNKPYGNKPSVVSLQLDGKFDDYMGIASESPKIGSKVWFAGYPSNKFNSKVTYVSATAETSRLAYGPKGSEYWCIGVRDVAKPGYSGGPLFDEKYNVLGICFASNLPEGTPGLSSDSRVSIHQAEGSNEDWQSVFFHTQYLHIAADTETFEYVASNTTSKPVLTIFHSYTCLPCKRLVHEWNTDREFRQWLKDRFIVKWVNTERINPATNYPEPDPAVYGLRAKYKVTSIPFAVLEPGNFFAGYSSDSKFKRDCEELLKYRTAPPPPKDLPVEIKPDDNSLDAPLPIEEKNEPSRWQTIEKRETSTNEYTKPEEDQEEKTTTTLPAQTAPEHPSTGSAVPDNKQKDGSESEGFFSGITGGVGKTALLVGLGALTGGLPWYVPLGMRVGRRIFGSRASRTSNPPEYPSNAAESFTADSRGSPRVSGSSTPTTDNPFRSLLDKERASWHTERLGLVSKIEGLQTQVNSLRNREQVVTYQEVQADDGLARMREAQRLVSQQYPNKASTIRMIEQAYQLLLSGEGKVNA